MALIAKVLEVKAPYHIGWREPEPVISNITITRALLYVALSTGMKDIASSVVRGGFRASAALPMIISEGGVIHPLIPAPPLGSVAKLGSIKWFSASAVIELLKFMNECGGDVIISNLKEGRLEVMCTIKGNVLSNLKVRGEAVLSTSEYNYVRSDVMDVVSAHREIHNRVDRISNATDLYVISGYISRVPLWLLLNVEDNLVSDLINVLRVIGELGLGAFKSKGWGRFELRNEEVVETGLKYLKELVSYKGRGYYLSLGYTALPLSYIDLNRSVIKLGVLEGYSGDSKNPYALPKTLLISPGSIVYLVRDPYHISNGVIKVKYRYLDHEPVIPLSTLFLGAKS